MDKMRMESVDMTAQNIDKIGAIFPNCITETVDENGKPKKAINFEVLKQMLSGDVLEGDEAYEIFQEFELTLGGVEAVRAAEAGAG